VKIKPSRTAPPPLVVGLTVVDLHAGDDGIVGLLHVDGLADEVLEVLLGLQVGGGERGCGQRQGLNTVAGAGRGQRQHQHSDLPPIIIIMITIIITKTPPKLTSEITRSATEVMSARFMLPGSSCSALMRRARRCFRMENSGSRGSCTPGTRQKGSRPSA